MATAKSFQAKKKMFSNDRIKFATPLPGEEYKKYDLSIPAEAARMLYEIDFHHGGDKELALTILTRAFRGLDTVTKVLAQSAPNFKNGAQEGEAWRRKAMINRTVKISLNKNRLATLGERTKLMRKAIFALEQELSREKRLSRPPAPPAREEGEARPPDSGSIAGLPDQKEQLAGEIQGKQLELAGLEKEMATLVEEIAISESDPKCLNFSEGRRWRPKE